MKVLITGGAGFLGLHLAHFFTKKKYDVTLLDIQDFNSSEYAKDVHCVKGDIRDKKLVESLTKDIDLLIHAAAALPLSKPEEIYSTNIDGTEILLKASLKNKVKLFIYISSTAVYGIPKKHPIEETDPVIGVGAYGESKIRAEELCEEFRRKKLPVTVIRPKTFVGTYRLGVFEILFDWIKDGKKIPVVGSGNNRYQLLDVDDLVDAVYLLSKAGKSANNTFNIGAEKFRTVKEDLNELFRYADSGSTIFPTPATPLKISLRFF